MDTCVVADLFSDGATALPSTFLATLSPASLAALAPLAAVCVLCRHGRAMVRKVEHHTRRQRAHRVEQPIPLFDVHALAWSNLFLLLLLNLHPPLIHSTAGHRAICANCASRGPRLLRLVLLLRAEHGLLDRVQHRATAKALD